MTSVDVEVLEQRPLTIAEVKENLEEIKKLKKELNFRAEKVYNYANEFTKLNKKSVSEIYERLKSLNISKLRDRHITKIIDIMPDNPESLKIIFSGEATSLKQDEVKQILDAINAK